MSEHTRYPGDQWETKEQFEASEPDWEAWFLDLKRLHLATLTRCESLESQNAALASQLKEERERLSVFNGWTVVRVASGIGGPRESDAPMAMFMHETDAVEWARDEHPYQWHTSPFTSPPSPPVEPAP